MEPADGYRALCIYNFKQFNRKLFADGMNKQVIVLKGVNKFIANLKNISLYLSSYLVFASLLKLSLRPNFFFNVIDTLSPSRRFFSISSLTSALPGSRKL